MQEKWDIVPLPPLLPSPAEPTCGAPAQRRADLPLLRTTPATAGLRGSMKTAVAILDSKDEADAALAALRRDFFANSSRAAKSRKRADAEKLARMALDCQGLVDTDIYPLRGETLERVAAALKGADFRSAAAYLGELRQGHIEFGAEIPMWLALLFKRCKDAVERGLGPPHKAAELKVDDIVTDFEPDQSELAIEDVVHPRRAFIVATAWLLREIELAGLCVGHVQQLGDPTLISVMLPVSKTDKGGTGTSRTRRCICGEDTSVNCGVCAVRFQVALRLRELDLAPSDPQLFVEPLFPNGAGEVPAKDMLVRAWQALAPEGHPALGGHSARRSGCKALARAGWPLSALQLLGRWGSSAVLGYVEEALTEIDPQMAQGVITGDDGDGPVPAWEERIQALQDTIDKLVAKRQFAIADVPASGPPGGAQEDQGDIRWVAIEQGKLHLCASFSLRTPSSAWRTTCGVRFACGRAKFSLLDQTEAETSVHPKCARCAS